MGFGPNGRGVNGVACVAIEGKGQPIPAQGPFLFFFFHNTLGVSPSHSNTKPRVSLPRQPTEVPPPSHAYTPMFQRPPPAAARRRPTNHRGETATTPPLSASLLAAASLNPAAFSDTGRPGSRPLPRQASLRYFSTSSRASSSPVHTCRRFSRRESRTRTPPVRRSPSQIPLVAAPSFSPPSLLRFTLLS
ncbi:uncharacterized protein HKW66_Vig0152840 [Vigna angularis]|uniref:Uncharacterized protein n=1 Tax=Phaseolus angularis TaxID=3914 RepID=A0A8T0JXA9_PHAAN|nr:uncharacterized protein HKW66_Vig0152840 [Vigna angularis]